MLIAVRWNVIAVPSRGLLIAEIASVRARFPALVATSDPSAQVVQIAKLLDKAEKANCIAGLHPFHFDLLFWSRGSENFGWSLVHEAEEQLVQLQSPDDIRTGLERSESLLRKSSGWGSTELADQIHVELGRTVAVLTDAHRSILSESLDLVHRLSPGLRATVVQQLTGANAPAPSAADVAAFASTLSSALQTQTTLLTSRITFLRNGDSAASSPEFQMLVEHVGSVLLPATVTLIQSFQNPVQSGASVATPVNPFRAASDYLALADDTAARIESALSVAPVVPLDRWKALLSEALGVIYDRRDTDFASLLSWHNKTIWLIECGLLLILALAATLDHSVFFLLGATGGLLSRLSRSLYRADVQTDYGASWTTLFLSPVVGAMAGWAGMLIASLAVNLGVLGSLFKSITWENPYAELAMAFAFVLGFSERLFDTILSQLQDKVVSKSITTNETTKPAITTDGTLPSGVVGTEYTKALAASGGTPGYTWKCIAGTLPPGLSLGASTGAFSQKPTTAGDFKFTIEVKDKSGTTTNKEFSLSIK